MRNLWRMLAFDIVAPLAGIAGLLMVGLALDWPLWWVSVCSVLVLLIVEGVALNFLLLRRDSATVGTDDDRPGLRSVVVALCAAALVAAVVLEYTRWTQPDRDLKRDAEQVVQVAVDMSEAAATVSPADPNVSIERAAEMMVPDRVNAFKESIGRSATDMANRNIAVQARTLAAGVEAIGPSVARVAVILRSTQRVAEQQVRQMVVPVRITLSKRNGRWLVLEMSPVHVR
ncbi:MAG TPA: hypothetical protein VFQ37_02140 [Mycobacterium sp.]|nr:hypothetical protein [Mycobacterium sp.]